MVSRGGPYRDSGGRGADFRRILGRIFGDAENPMGWALTVGRVAGIRVRLHLLFIVYATAQILYSIPRDTLGVGFTALAMTSLFVIVLLHEFGHCFACRAVGGEADDILMWPLGGLATVSPPHEWRAHLITTLGGPAVNAALTPVFAGLLMLAGQGDAVLFNPFRPSVAVGAMGSWWLVALWWLHYTNLLILGFNMLLPLFPLDGGRTLQAVLWRRMGYAPSMDVAATVGVFGAIALGVFALVGDHVLLLGIAIFAGLVSWQERRRLRAADDLGEVGFESVYRAQQEEARERGPTRSQRKQAEREQQVQVELDRILAKIAASGMGALSAKEKKALRDATERKRRGGSG
ncbi:MAG: hypothetical protein IBJ10_01015 [Phycisphaerales bacterium]|nr:hypothetical protein [Phycisphaerales bacterium]